MDDKNHDRVEDRRRLNPWIVALLLFFVFLLGANGFMIYRALTTFSGVTTPHHYEQGLAFNTILAQRKGQNESGVSAWLLDPGLVSGESGKVRLVLKDRLGAPLTGVQVQGVLYRSVQAGMDQPFVMLEQEPGHYETRITPPLPGHWELRLELRGTVGLLFYN
ncbi:MAG TPA: hypothetical protein HPQ00_04110, partial [Magnetococcales bacterium]|nr:hypothetical protein [Magnetococcales bacterium]